MSQALWISFIVPAQPEYGRVENFCFKAAARFGFKVVTTSVKAPERFDGVMAAQRRKGCYRGFPLAAIILVCPPPGNYGDTVVVNTIEEIEAALRNLLVEHPADVS